MIPTKTLLLIYYRGNPNISEMDYREVHVKQRKLILYLFRRKMVFEE